MRTRDITSCYLLALPLETSRGMALRLRKGTAKNRDGSVTEIANMGMPENAGFAFKA